VAGKAAELLEVTPERAVAEGRTEDQDMRSSIAEYNERARMVTDVVRAYVDEGGTIRTALSPGCTRSPNGKSARYSKSRGWRSAGAGR
jgi:adenine-specific DNA glycosylase